MKKMRKRWMCLILAAGVLFSAASVTSAAPATSSGSSKTSAGSTTTATTKTLPTTTITTSTGKTSTTNTSSGTTGTTGQNLVPAKKVKVKSQTFSLQTARLQKKSVKVKTGTYDLTLKKKEEYLRFVSKKTRVYAFRISSFLTKKKGTATVMFQAPDTDDPDFSYLINITKSGKTKEALEYKTQKATKEKKSAVAAGQTFGGKTVRMRLKKGQVLYIYIGSDYTKTTAKLQIS